MSGWKSFPVEDAFGATPYSTPFWSKNALIVTARLRAHDAARGSELAAGVYFA